MTYAFKKFTPLLLAGLLCTSAVPAHSTESWSSLALKGLGTYAAFIGIGLGSAVAHEYGHAIATEILEPGSVDAIVIGASHSQQSYERLRKNHRRLMPIFFPEGFSVLRAFGVFGGYVMRSMRFNKWPETAMVAAGPLAGAGFCVSMAAATCFLWPHTQRSDIAAFPCIAFLAGHLSQFYAVNNSDGALIQQELGIHKWLYNALVTPAIGCALLYAGRKIFKVF